MSIRVVIVDDEPQSVMRLQADLSAYDDMEVVATSSSAVSAKALVVGMQPDVLFIDMEMPGLSGMNVLQSLQGEVPGSFIVVFYSAFDKYMIDALRASAYDFLLKPYRGGELDVVVDRIRQKMNEDDAPCGNGLSLELLALEGMTSRQVAVQTISGLLMVRPEEVFGCFFDEDSHLWYLRMKTGMVHTLRKQTTARTVLSISPPLFRAGAPGLHHQSGLSREHRELHPALHLHASLRPGGNHRLAALLQDGEGEARDIIDGEFTASPAYIPVYRPHLFPSLSLTFSSSHRSCSSMVMWLLSSSRASGAWRRGLTSRWESM